MLQRFASDSTWQSLNRLIFDAKRQKLQHDDASAPATVSSGPTPALSPVAQQRVELIALVADCEVEVAGTVFSGLHKAYLVGASGVLRSLAESFKGDTRIPLRDDDPRDVALLLSLIYEL